MKIEKEVFTKKKDGTVHFHRKEADHIRKRLIHLAQKKAEKIKCKCGEKKRRVVPLFEYGDPYIPSQVVIFCPECGRNEVFSSRPIGEARHYAELVAGKRYDGKKMEDRKKDKAEDLIEKAIENAKNPSVNKVEEEEATVKDEKSEIIADKETVTKIESKRRK